MMRHLGLGPVFAYEWLMASRKWQMYALRSLFVLALGITLTIVWQSKVPSDILTIKNSAKVGEAFFYGLVGVELCLVLLVAPAAVAGTVCVDKARGTLLHVLATDLTNAEIVLGKLAARLIPVYGLIFCTLPVLYGAVLLGGIDPESVTGAFLIMVAIGTSSCSLALLLSVWSKKSYEVVLVTYITWACLMLSPYVSNQLAGLVFNATSPAWLSYLDPFRLAFLPYLSPGSSYLPEQLGFLAGHMLASAACVGLAIASIRRAAVSQSSAVARKKKWRLAPPRLPAWVGPRLDPNPVLWREWHRQRPSGWTRIVWWVFGCLATVFTILAITTTSTRGFLAPWVNALQVSIGMLLLSVGAVTSLQDERTRGSLDALLASPLSTQRILWGKWWGTFRGVARLAILPAILGFTISIRSQAWLGLWVLVGMVISYGLAVTSFGLAVATWISRPAKAMAICVGVYTLVTVGSFMLGIFVWGRSEEFSSLSPFFGPGSLTAAMENSHGRYPHLIVANIIWIVCYILISLLLFFLTLRSFDRCMGRMTNREPPRRQ